MILKWFRIARWLSLPQSMLPAFTALALALAAGKENFSWILGITGITGVWFLHLGMNLFDDYFDYKYKGVDYRERMAAKGIKARIAKCTYLIQEGGTETLRKTFWVAVFFVAIAFICGAIIFYFRGIDFTNGITVTNAGWSIICIALTVGFLGVEYSAPPLKLSYHGLADIVIGFIFGPLLMLGIYVSACGDFSWQILFFSVPVGLLVSNILFTDSMLEFNADRSVGKKNLAVVIGKQKKNLVISAFCNFAPPVIVTLGIIYADFSSWYILVWLSCYLAVALFYYMIWFVKDPNRKFERKMWMGPFQKWDNIVKYGIDWYMLRWYIARNYVVLFCFIVIVISLIR
ncbi:MAG: prenyltransferase [Bacteroidales bacterium]|jgi:1,4-dihydroxy-2-naphthoate octaprenyltransferase|nr:prenyltransferase [Bacteroidales bacterium]